MTTITRIGYCEKCAKEHRPKTGESFLAFGSSSQTWKPLMAKRNAIRGLTPHNYLMTAHNDEEVAFHKMCCVCGSYEEYNEEAKILYVVLNERAWSEVEVIRLEDWNALVLFKDTGLEI